MYVGLIIYVYGDNDQKLYNDFKIFKLVFCIYLLIDVLEGLNILNKIFQSENADLNYWGHKLN